MNQKMSKSLALFLCFTMFAALLSGCGGNKGESPQKEDTLQVVTTIFPEYDWVRNILGAESKHADLTLLLDNGVDLHSFQPAAADIARIASADVFVYVGGESDEWVEDALKEATNKDMKVVNLLEALGSRAKTEEVVEGMTAEEEDEEEVFDEHVWLSLKNASYLVDTLENALSEADPDHAEEYEKNASAYRKELSELDKAYENAVEHAKRDTLLFGDRFPFRYLTEDYGLNYYAAFVGCSAETEASFETITFLSEKMKKLGLSTVLTIDNSDAKIAKTILQTAKVKDGTIQTLNAMQATSSQEVLEGATYLSIMEQNLDVLTQALN